VYATSGYGNAVAGFAQRDGVGIVGRSPAGLAGLFFGPVVIQGALTVTGAKSAAVSLPDGTYRQLYALEAPESWFEDFGSAELQRVVAHVAIEPTLAQVVTLDAYHVFLTPMADCRGLYVVRRSSDGFVVRVAQSGTSEVRFDYRIVARRLDLDAGRLEHLAIPSAAEQAIETPPRGPTGPGDPRAPRAGTSPREEPAGRLYRKAILAKDTAAADAASDHGHQLLQLVLQAWLRRQARRRQPLRVGRAGRLGLHPDDVHSAPARSAEQRELSARDLIGVSRELRLVPAPPAPRRLQGAPEQRPFHVDPLVELTRGPGAGFHEGAQLAGLRSRPHISDSPHTAGTSTADWKSSATLYRHAEHVPAPALDRKLFGRARSADQESSAVVATPPLHETDSSWMCRTSTAAGASRRG
jgi:hypothetical protein